MSSSPLKLERERKKRRQILCEIIKKNENLINVPVVRIGSKRMVLLNRSGDSMDIAGSKYKRRSVSAVRDFPPGCGRPRAVVAAPVEEAVFVGTIGRLGGKQMNVDENRHVVVNVELEGARQPMDRATSDKRGCSDMDQPKDYETSHGCSDMEQPKDYETLDKRVSFDVKQPMDSETLDNCLNSEVKQSLDNENSDKHGYVNVLEEKSSMKAEDLLNGTVKKKTFKPRRVSAVRDFPPFCGRNPPCLVKEEELAKVASHVDLMSMDQVSSCVEEKLEETVKIDNERKEDGIQDELAGGSSFNGCDSKLLDDGVEPEAMSFSIKETKKEVDCGASVEKNVEFATVELEQGLILGIMATDSKKEVDSGASVQKKIEVARVESEQVLVLGIMAADTCPFRRTTRQEAKRESALINQKAAEVSHQPKPVVKKRKSVASLQRKAKEQSLRPNEDQQGAGQMILWENSDNGGCDDDDDDDDEVNDFRLVERLRNLDVALPPSHRSKNDADETVTRSKVRETLRVFQAVCRKLLQEEETRSREGVITRRRVDLKAALILKDKKRYLNMGKIIGSVPGVEVGDEFQYRIELHIIGLHRPSQAGIDYVIEGSKPIAISIVTAGVYDNDTGNADELIYTGSGGTKTKDHGPEDQKLERGNLALKNSVKEKNPVRVIRGDTKASDSDGRGKTYIYDGLYVVDKYWSESSSQGTLVFKFRLVRIPGQPEIAWKVLKRSKKFEREGICLDDISKGQEHLPICAVNTIDDEKPPKFTYVTKMIYPDWCRPIPPKGCDCTKRCSESGKCSCVAKNGGEIPYNHNGAIVEAKPLVYECGPSCRCPPSCYNRVAQKGITFRLELFKTETRGWGVRSLNSIPSGSFICEYIGELLEENEAEERTGNDEYLFDIGNEYNDASLWDGLNTLMPDSHPSSLKEVIHSSFTIDAAQYGNVGRFINHSCTPNLYAQNVLYDNEDKRIPHIMLFAAENISPLQELTYHYNYMIDQVLDSNGNIRRKDCYCGSSECTGRMY